MAHRPLFLCVALWGLAAGGYACAQGLPVDPKAYLAERARLIDADAALRFDADVKLDAREIAVNEKLLGLRRALTAGYKRERRFPPSEPFYTVKDEIGKTDLYRFLRGMPKGGDLHLHTSSTAPVGWLLEHGIREPNCHVCWPDDRGKAIKGQIGFFRPHKAPPGYRPVADLLAADPAFPDKLRALLTINAGDAAYEKLTKSFSPANASVIEWPKVNMVTMPTIGQTASRHRSTACQPPARRCNTAGSNRQSRNRMWS